MNANPYNPRAKADSISDRSFPWLAYAGLVFATILTATSAIAILEGYEFLSMWYGYRGNPNAPSIVWRGRFNVRPLMGLYQFAFVTLMLAAACCLLAKRSRIAFRAAFTITATGFVFWAIIGLKYAIYRY